MRKNKVLSIAAAIAAAVVLSTTSFTTAFAASRTDTAEVLGATRDRDDAGEAAVLGASRAKNTVEVTYGDITDENALAGLQDMSPIVTAINADYKALGKNVTTTADNLEIVISMDVEVPEGTEISADAPLYITFTVPGVTESTRVHVCHFNHENKWEEVPSTAGEGTVVGTFTELSPVAVVVEKDTLQTSAKGENSAVSPRTGESQITVFAMMVGAAAIGGIILVSSKKKKA